MRPSYNYQSRPYHHTHIHTHTILTLLQHALMFYQHCAIKYTNLRGGTHPPPPLRLDGAKLAYDARLRHHFQRWLLVTSHYAIVVQYPTLPNSTGARSLYILASIFFPTFELFPHFLLHGSAKGLNHGSNQPDHILFQNKFFNYFCALFWGPRGSCPLFSDSTSPATYPHIFPTFRTFSHCLLQGSFVHLHPGLVVFYLRPKSKQGCPTYGLYSLLHPQPCLRHLHRLPFTPTSNVTPTPKPPPQPLRQNRPELTPYNLHGGIYSPHNVLNTYPILFFKTNIFCPLWGPWGFCPPFSHSPSPARFPLIF